MNTPSPARRLARVLTVASLLMSGLYMFVYLYRWEWNRALIAGVFFLGAEIALATSLILARLPEAATAPEREAEPPPPFAWLAPLARGEGFGVFVPVLLGAGVVLSTLAFAVERLAAVATRGVRPGSPVPAFLSLPSGGYTHRAAGGVPPVSARSRTRPGRLIAAAVLATGGTVVSVDLLADATQARPDARQAGITVVVVEGERRTGPSATAALRLWERCRALLPAGLPITTDSDRRSRVTAEVGTVLGPLAEKKLRGCLEDASLPGIRGNVVSFERELTDPARTPVA